MRLSQRLVNADRAVRIAILGAICGVTLALVALANGSAQANYWTGTMHYVKADGEDKSYRRTEVNWNNWTCSWIGCSLPVNQVMAFTNIIVSQHQYDYEYFEIASSEHLVNGFYGVTLNHWNTPGSSVLWSPYSNFIDVYHSGIEMKSSVCDDNDCLFYLEQGAFDVVFFPYTVNNPYQSAWGIATSYP
jgi:hypothetical protein